MTAGYVAQFVRDHGGRTPLRQPFDRTQQAQPRTPRAQGHAGLTLEVPRQRARRCTQPVGPVRHVALVAGVVVGALAQGVDTPVLTGALGVIESLGQVWLNALRMTVIPLVFSLLVTGIVSIADAAATGRIAVRSLVVFAVLMFGHILLIIGVPFVLGLWCAHRFPNWTTRFKKPLRILSFIALIAFIVGAIAGNWRYFLDYVGLVLLAVVIHDALAFGTGYAIARMAGLPDYDRRALSIEVGIRNAGLGLVLIFSFFGGLGGMAVVAGVWGFWDIIAGLALASWWARRPLQGGVPEAGRP